ncbi:MAG: hypothetical protein MUD15_13075 [Desulfobacterota bacterium]|nr:hypothetical protein [Thermodesulfobacteriota bacterium]
MITDAHDYIDAFRRGENVRGPLAGLITNGRPDGTALEVLGRGLADSDAQAREKIVDLLVQIGLETDPLTPEGAEVLRDRRIIAILSGPGLAKADLGREAALDALRKLVTPGDLAPFEDAYVKSLIDEPCEEAFLLVAKAKPVEQKVLVESLARSSEWIEEEAARIARAALGAKAIEDEYLAAVDTAADGRELAMALGPLALMGTPRSLKALAGLLRSPLVIHVPGLFDKSVRLNVLDALSYNFPDQPVLYANNIITEEDYTAAERFCTSALGVTYTTPPPPFMTLRGYPFPP